ncbi:MAG: hypothetical protein K2L80_03800 [Muribaculaceae bacterium]|nr:hypothetical protein [Muribaculaceae bacterium]
MSLLDIIAGDVRAFSAHCPELMFNERDYQMQLAVFLRQTGHYEDVDVEYFIPNDIARKAGYEWDSHLRLDIVVRKGGKFAIIELKYTTARVSRPIKRFGQTLPDVEIMKQQGAQDLVSYNFWKDVRRIEIVKTLFPNVTGGLAVMLTNDPYYVRGAKSGSLCELFSTADKRKNIHGFLDWTRQTGTTKGLPGFTLDGNYSVQWYTYEIENINFFQTIIPVQ